MTETTDFKEYSPEFALAFKANAVKVAHEYGNNNNYCEVFDEILHEIGLPGRDSYYEPACNDPECQCGSQARPRPILVGEPTEAEFNAWKLKTARALYEQINYRGLYGPETQAAMEQAGFPTREEIQERTRSVTAQIDGTFSVKLAVEMLEGTDLIEYVSNIDVLDAVTRAFRAERVTWKATIADETAPAVE